MSRPGLLIAIAAVALALARPAGAVDDDAAARTQAETQAQADALRGQLQTIQEQLARSVEQEQASREQLQAINAQVNAEIEHRQRVEESRQARVVALADVQQTLSFAWQVLEAGGDVDAALAQSQDVLASVIQSAAAYGSPAEVERARQAASYVAQAQDAVGRSDNYQAMLAVQVARALVG